MKRRPLALWAYVGLVTLAGGVTLTLVAGQWRQVEVRICELVVFFLLAGILDVMVVPVAGGGGVAASFAVLFAGLLILGPGPSAWVAACAGVFSEGAVRRRGLMRVSFNAAHGVLSLVCAGWVYRLLGGEVAQLQLRAHLPAVVGAAMCVWLLETTWLAAAVALERGGLPAEVSAKAGLSAFGGKLWRRLKFSLGPTAVVEGALASVGLLLALIYLHRKELVGASGWSAAGGVFLWLMVFIPCGLLYYAYRLQGHLQGVYAQSLRTLGALLEAKVGGSQPGHGEQVAKLAASLAETLELSPREVDQVRYAGYLHDIGKVAVPSSLLQHQPETGSPDPVPAGLRLHPEIGAGILSPVHLLKPAAEMVRCHHERWDGLGYPGGLRQKDIPLGARLLALADAYVGLTHSRLSPHQALSRLRQASRSRFDPELLPALETLLAVSGTELSS